MHAQAPWYHGLGSWLVKCFAGIPSRQWRSVLVMLLCGKTFSTCQPVSCLCCAHSACYAIYVLGLASVWHWRHGMEINCLYASTETLAATPQWYEKFPLLYRVRVVLYDGGRLPMRGLVPSASLEHHRKCGLCNKHCLFPPSCSCRYDDSCYDSGCAVVCSLLTEIIRLAPLNGVPCIND